MKASKNRKAWLWISGGCVAFFIGVVGVSVSAATVTVRPNGDVTAQWGTGGTSDGTCSGDHCSRIDETTPSTADYIDTPALLGGSLVDLFEIGNASVGQRATQVTIRTYVRSGLALPVLDAMDTVTPSLWIGGAYTAGAEITPDYPNWAWFDTTFTGSWTQSDIDAMRVRYVNNIKGLGLVQNNLQIATSEVVVTYTPDASLTQSVYRVYQNANSVTPGAPLAAQNTPADTASGSAFRIRMGVDVASNPLLASSRQYKLQYAPKVGTCDTAFSGENYVDVGASGSIHWRDNAGVSSGASISSYAFDPTTTGPTVYQAYEEANPFTNPQQVNSGSSALWDLSLEAAAQTVGSYCFRMVRSDGQLFSQYTAVPEVSLTGSLDIDLVDGSGQPVSQPIGFNSTYATSTCQTSLGTLGTSTQRVRVTNNSASYGWTVDIAPTVGSSARWLYGARAYDVNDSSGCTDGPDSDGVGGKMTINPSAGTFAPQGGCSGTGVSLGSTSSYQEGVVGSVTLASASHSTQRFCSWDFTGIGLSQTIPSYQAPGVYSVDMTLTVIAQ